MTASAGGLSAAWGAECAAKPNETPSMKRLLLRTLINTISRHPTGLPYPTRIPGKNRQPSLRFPSSSRGTPVLFMGERRLAHPFDQPDRICYYFVKTILSPADCNSITNSPEKSFNFN
jgi:hypothetical protein